jgi:hypothetical protein
VRADEPRGELEVTADGAITRGDRVLSGRDGGSGVAVAGDDAVSVVASLESEFGTRDRAGSASNTIKSAGGVCPASRLKNCCSDPLPVSLASRIRNPWCRPVSYIACTWAVTIQLRFPLPEVVVAAVPVVAGCVVHVTVLSVQAPEIRSA